MASFGFFHAHRRIEEQLGICRGVLKPPRYWIRLRLEQVSNAAQVQACDQPHGCLSGHDPMSKSVGSQLFFFANGIAVNQPKVWKRGYVAVALAKL